MRHGELIKKLRQPWAGESSIWCGPLPSGPMSISSMEPTEFRTAVHS
jgi:hypothetical protein